MVGCMRLALALCVIFTQVLAFTVNITRVPVSEPVTPIHHLLA